MCGLSMLLAEGQIVRGWIIKEQYGHMLVTCFNRDEDTVSKLGDNLMKTGAKMIEQIEGDKHKIRKRIKELNRFAGLPGVAYTPKSA